MREILFRAKRIDNGEWVYGNFIYSDDADEEYRSIIIPVNKSDMYTDTDDKDIGFETWYKVNPETLCQYTGLKDKNGNRIWENDIVRIENSMDEGIGNIEFYGGMWYVDGKPSNSLYDIMEYDDIAEIEVIGNIFANPEMLKEQ